MATRRPLALIGGALKELPTDDTLPASSLPEATEAAQGAMSAEDKTKLNATPLIIVSDTEPAGVPDGTVWIDIS